jgi:hypothetical protein
MLEISHYTSRCENDSTLDDFLFKFVGKMPVRTWIDGFPYR